MLTQESLKAQLKYDPETGIFTWLKVQPGISYGKIAGTKTTRGYIQIKIEYKIIGAHRLAWLLRLSTAAQNSANTKLSIKNTSGIKGVNWNKQLQKWCAEIKISGIKHFLGYYDNIETATQIRKRFAERMLGEFARHE